MIIQLSLLLLSFLKAGICGPMLSSYFLFYFFEHKVIPTFWNLSDYHDEAAKKHNNFGLPQQKSSVNCSLTWLSGKIGWPFSMVSLLSQRLWFKRYSVGPWDLNFYVNNVGVSGLECWLRTWRWWWLDFPHWSGHWSSFWKYHLNNIIISNLVMY